MLLGVRWRSREELRRRLLQAGFDPEEIEAALADLERVGLVEDERFAREVVRDQAQHRMSGERAIRAALRQRGVDDAVIQEALKDAGDEAERARELAQRRVQRMSNLGPEAAYRRLIGLLVRRGYGSGVAREVCREAVDGAFPGKIPEEDA